SEVSQAAALAWGRPCRHKPTPSRVGDMRGFLWRRRAAGAGIFRRPTRDVSPHFLWEALQGTQSVVGIRARPERAKLALRAGIRWVSPGVPELRPIAATGVCTTVAVGSPIGWLSIIQRVDRIAVRDILPTAEVREQAARDSPSLSGLGRC